MPRPTDSDRRRMVAAALATLTAIAQFAAPVVAQATATVATPTGSVLLKIDDNTKAAPYSSGDLSTQYVVGILKDNSPPEPPVPGARTVMMTAKNGKRFECSIPNTDPAALKELAGVVAAAAAAPTAAAETATTTSATPAAAATTPAAAPAGAPVPEPEPFHDIAEQVRATLGKGCFTKSEGYWTYEICPFKTVRQYHREGANGPITLSFSLGRHDPATDKIRTVSAPFVQQYTGGTDNRETSVRYKCNPDPKLDVGVHLLTAVTEPQPFRYVAEIITPLACPPAQASKTTAATATGAAAAAADAPRRAVTPAAQVIELLDPLTQNCLYLNNGWWLYRFCHLKGVTQLHREHRPVKGAPPPPQPPAPASPDGGSTPQPPQQQQQMELVTVAEFDLGHFDKDLAMSTVETATKIVAGATPEESYVSQTYTHGTQCDLLTDKAPRQTEVRLYCAPPGSGSGSGAGGATNGAVDVDANSSLGAVESIAEPSSCTYVLKVRTKLLCSHPLFARQQPPVHEITCRPVTTNTNPRR